MDILGDDSQEREAPRTQVRSAAAILSLYALIVWIAYFVVSTGVSPVLPAGVALVVVVQMVKVLKKTAALLIRERKAKRQVVPSGMVGETSSAI